MGTLDLSADEPGGGFKILAGLRHVYIEDAEERVSNAGNAMIQVILKEVGTNHFVARDWLMLSGGGAHRTARALKAMGLDLSDGSPVVPDMLRGRRAWAMLDVEERTYEGKQYKDAKVQGFYEGSAGGYFPDGPRPEGHETWEEDPPKREPQPTPTSVYVDSMKADAEKLDTPF